MKCPSLLLSAGSALLLIACAQGGTLEPGFGGAAGGGGEGGTVHTSSSSSSASGSSSSSSSSSSSGASSSSSSSSGASSSSSSSSGSTSSSGGTCNFNPPADCPNAENLPAIAGDEGSDVRSASGKTSKWFNLFVEEAVSALFEYPDIKYRATLTSPPGAQYGLFVYTGDATAPSCFDSAVQGTGSPAVVTDAWSDTPILDDGLWITLEVRHLSGNACGPNDLWTLTVQGNTD